MRGALIPPAGGAGLGLRRPLLDALLALAPASGPEAVPDFLEIAPENWIGVGGRYSRGLRRAAERWPIWLHGLSLDIGGPRPLDVELLARIQDLRRTLADAGGALPPYSEHLSYCADDGHLYDLLPIPFTGEAVRYVAARVREAQDRLGERIALENSSYYVALGSGVALGNGVALGHGAVPGQELTELEFIKAVLAEADCELLLDVNNLYVNSVNHGYDPRIFLHELPAERVRYLHLAGHYPDVDDDGAPLLVDTHGAAVIEPVWALLAETYRLCGPLPTLLERDFNCPPLAELLTELAAIGAAQGEAG